MHRITLHEFMLLEPAEIFEGPCFEVTLDGQVLFVAVVGAQMGMIARVQGLCSQLDASRGNPRMPLPPSEEVEHLPGLVHAGIGGEVHSFNEAPGFTLSEIAGKSEYQYRPEGFEELRPDAC